jgi:hypothetical protein
MTTEHAHQRRRPWFGVASAIMPFIFGGFSFEWHVIADMAPRTEAGYVVTPVLFALLFGGIGFAIVAIMRKESRRWLAITGLGVNLVLLAFLALVVVTFLVFGNKKIV